MKYDIAVVGLGPGGLAAALEAASAGKSVVAFTDREQYVRQQRMILDEDTVEFLEKFQDEGDEKFFNKIKEEWDSGIGTIAQTKDIERYLFSKLSGISAQNPSRVQLIQANKNNQDSTNNVSKIGKTPEGVHFIETSSGEQFEFQHLLAADGARHGTASIVENYLTTIDAKDASKSILYTPSAYQERSKYQAAVQLRIKPDMPAAPLSYMSQKVRQEKMNDYFNDNIEKFARYGWKEKFPPKVYVLPNAKGTKFSFAGEVPEELLNSKEQKEKLRQWASLSIEAQYGVTPDNLEFQLSKKAAKNKLQAAAFEMNLVQCKESLIPLGEKSYFAQVGDARRTPNFHLGHGLNDAIAGGIEFVKRIGPESFDQKRYSEKIKEMDETIDTRMRDAKRLHEMEQSKRNDLEKRPSLTKDNLMEIKKGDAMEKEERPQLLKPDL